MQSASPGTPPESPADTKITGSYEGYVPTDVLVPALTLLAHPDTRRVGERVILPELKGAGTVRLSRTEPTFVQPRLYVGRALDSVHLSRQPILLQAGSEAGSVTIERGSCRAPAAVDGESLAERHTASGDDLARGVVLLLGHRVVLLLHLDRAIPADLPEHGLVGASPEIQLLREEIGVAAQLNVPVLLRGESGTGKELLARAVHDASRRRDRPYVAVNMAAVPSTLAASELFGATKGAFTGADRKKEGFFQRATGGTLFLDEIGDAPDDVQPLLLRVLENGEIQPLGSAETRQVNVRVLAATDADLESQIDSGKFRKPLLHRLAGYEIRLPPLRQRRSDFGRLLFHFLRQELESLDAGDALEGQENAKRPWPPAGLVARLARCEWPGNVRQLKNVARRMAVARATGTELRIDAELLGQPLPDSVAESGGYDAGVDDVRSMPTAAAPSPPHGWRPAYRKPSEVSEDELLETLRAHRFELKACAEALGISRASLYAMVGENPRIRKASDVERAEMESVLAKVDHDLVDAAAELEVSVHALRRQIKTLGLDA